MQLKSDILNEAVGSLSVAMSSDDPNNLEESSDPLHPIEAPPANMLDILLNGIGGGLATPNDQVNTATAKQLCENEMYQLLLGNDFKMNMQNIEKTAYNCPLSWWKLSHHKFKNLESLAVKYLAIPATSAPSERIWSRAERVLTVKRNRMSEEVTSAMMYCRENRELLHKYMWRLLGRGCIRMTIILLRDNKLFCLHLKMKRMLTQKLMLEWMRTKSCEEEGNVFRILYVFT